MDIIYALLSRIKVSSSGCFEWTGNRLSNGYGRIRLDGKEKKAHRVSYEAFRSPIPARLCVCHKCDNPPCINPAHLFLGTVRENTLDAKQKGRLAIGERNSHAKLTPEQVVEIIHRFSIGESRTALSSVFGVSRAIIDSIVSGRCWTHIPRPDSVKNRPILKHVNVTASQVIEIRRKCAAGEKQRDVAREYGIAQSQVGRIHRRENWSHLP